MKMILFFQYLIFINIDLAEKSISENNPKDNFYIVEFE